MYRKSMVSLRFRRSVSWWTSVGVAATLLAGVVLVSAFEAFQEHFTVGRADDTDAEPRKLNQFIKSDPFIDSPIETAPNKFLVFIHIIIIAYMLLGLNTVCDAYFTGALDQMVNKWNVKPDVAGATFMAAGGSAPELFTSLIGTIVSESDVGFGTIVGSAVFNVLFVIGLCGFAAKEPIALTWWPLFRDCSYYIFGLTILAVFSKTGGKIELWEAAVLFLAYIGYCTIMYFNPVLEDKFVNRKGDPQQDEVTRMDQVAPIPDTGSAGGYGPEPGKQQHHIHVAQPKFNRSQSLSQHGMTPGALAGEPKKDSSPEAPKIEEEGAEDDEDEDDIEAMLFMPDSPVAQVVWFLSLPIYVPLYYLIPKPTNGCFLYTFGVSLVFIAGFSLFLVYCVEILGEVLGIHVIVMGFTLLAAGTSIPDAVSSVAVARAGEGDMAVSSSIGSNIFDILVGLPIPWMIKIVIVDNIIGGEAGSTVNILSEYIVLYVLILMCMVLCVILSIHYLGWVLNRTLGIGMASLYAVFLITVLSVEFGKPEALKF